MAASIIARSEIAVRSAWVSGSEEDLALSADKGILLVVDKQVVYAAGLRLARGPELKGS